MKFYTYINACIVSEAVKLFAVVFTFFDCFGTLRNRIRLRDVSDSFFFRLRMGLRSSATVENETMY